LDLEQREGDRDDDSVGIWHIAVDRDLDSSAVGADDQDGCVQSHAIAQVRRESLRDAMVAASHPRNRQRLHAGDAVEQPLGGGEILLCRPADGGSRGSRT